MATKTESFKTTLSKLEVYPKLKIDHPKNPNRMWAFPVLGGLLKVVILIPIFIELVLLFTFDFFVTIINSFIVLTTGKYWPFCFEFNLGLMRLLAKVTFFFSGLTDKYPGFDFKLDGFELDLEMPKNPNKLFAIPVLGILARIILLIPFGIFSSIISNASRLGTVISSVPVFFKGQYPEATYELTRDSMRLSIAQTAYIVGIHDNYPSPNIDWKHKSFKLVLIAIAIVFTIFQATTSEQNSKKSQNNDYAPYQNTAPNLNNYH